MTRMDIATAIISLLGGLAMFLYGIEAMGDGLKNSSGAALKRVLEKVTGNVILGVLTGTLVTAVIQSSTATIVLTVALIGAGVLNLKQAVSIVMGANIGTTITAQIIRLGSIEAGDNWFLWVFDTDTLAPIALLIGIILLMFVKSKKTKPIGDICIGFGVLFVGLNLMTEGVKPLIGTDAFTAFMGVLGNPWLGILFGLVLTVIVQSSSATVGMLQTVAAVPGSGVTFAMAYPIIMGINLGTCVTTAMVCSIGSSKDAKRTGVVHIAFNTIGTVLFMAVMMIMQRFAVFGAEFWKATVDSGGIANFQTIFNLLTAIVLIPFSGLLVKLSMLIVKEDKQKPQRHAALYALDEKLYISPAVAVAEATKSVAVMGTVARANFAQGCKMLVNYDESKIADIDEDENELDQFADRSDRFLIGLSKVIESEADDRQVDMLMQTVPNFERIGDYATNLVELGQRLNEAGTSFSDIAKQELNLICSAVDEILDITIKAFSEDDNEGAKSIEPLEEVIDDMVMILRDRHTKRLKNGTCSVDTGLVFMEALTYLERASDQCSSIAVMMLSRDNEAILQNHYDYLREIHSGNDAAYATEKARRREQYIKPLKQIV
ncbi:MAG: Na/Pi cotransporter family protein [Ruminococcaceae bacterium]|nr:Na/Pi cotransporter family protein [Oscillospiraceae bacterium]MBQ3215216.1 Na/Pi cotransporter family protein [Oscillospiraceae bacterium]